MNSRQKKTLVAIFANPVPVDLTWGELESLLLAVGAKKVEGRGSRVRFNLDDNYLVLHKPHNPVTLRKYQIDLARAFFEKTGIIP